MREITTRSLSFFDINGEAYITLCSEDGRQYRIKLTDTQVALLSEGAAKHSAEVVRRKR